MPTLQPQGMRSVWARTLSHQGQLLWGGEKPGLQVPGLSFTCQKKESVLTLGFPPSPCPCSVTALLTEGGSFFFLTVAVSSLQVLHPERKVKHSVYRKLCLVGSSHPVLPSQTWSMDPFPYLRFLAHAIFLKLLFCVLHRRKREKKF